MSKDIYNINIGPDGEGGITIFNFDAGTMWAVSTDDPLFAETLAKAVAGITPSEQPVTALLSDRVRIKGQTVEFDGEAVDSTVAATLLRFVDEGRDTDGVVRFMEKLEANPSETSKAAIYAWLNGTGLEINPEGNIIGYKGLRTTGFDVYESVNSGTAWVNGVQYVGNIPQKVGDTVTMPREDVDDNPESLCSYGLHVGSEIYASGWGSCLTVVEVDPADVVSVPSDHTGEKMRVSRYKIVDVFNPEVDYEGGAYSPDEGAVSFVNNLLPTHFLKKLRNRARKVVFAW